MKRVSAIAIFSLALLLCPAFASAAAPDYPEIRVLSADDPLFVQQQAGIEEFYRLNGTRGVTELPPLALFSYRKKPSEDLFSLNARLGIPYDTLATLNNAASVRTFNARARVLVSAQPGVFVNIPPRTTLEEMMLASRLAEGKAPVKLLIIRDGRSEPVSFFPGDTFTGMERAYFLGILFEFPVAHGRITSLFGSRKDPFTGRQELHGGIDIGAAEGTAVRAAREGIVEEAGRNDALGAYVVLTHPGGYQTVYGHLSAINVSIGESVRSGSVIGAVGHTGQATGSHLHFEVRTKGIAKDPLSLLAMKKG